MSRAVETMRLAIWAELISGHFALISAAVPATTGADADVPAHEA